MQTSCLHMHPNKVELAHRSTSYRSRPPSVSNQLLQAQEGPSLGPGLPAAALTWSALIARGSSWHGLDLARPEKYLAAGIRGVLDLDRGADGAGSHRNRSIIMRVALGRHPIATGVSGQAGSGFRDPSLSFPTEGKEPVALQPPVEMVRSKVLNIRV
jgi:hypothetical protein